MLTIKNKLIGMTLFGMAITGTLGISSFSSINNINNSMNTVIVDTSIMRNQMMADMMHDALNSDVQAALLASETTDVNALSKIEKEIKEHSEILTGSLTKNEELITDKEDKAALIKISPTARNYIVAANNVMQLTKTDRTAALKEMDSFHKIFTNLETEMDSLSTLIESHSKTKANVEKNKAMTVLIILSIVGAVIMLFLSYSIINSITSSLRELIRVSERVASGDLSVAINTAKEDELGELARAMEKMRNNLTLVISEITQTTSKIFLLAEDISTITSESSASISQQCSDTEQVATAMNEMTATVHEVANNVSASATSASKAMDETKSSSRIVEEAIQSITLLANQIGDASEIINQVESNTHNISSVLDVIKNIADQTNLLALNAAIEAARAGEQGRGFAVVADEVRTLASRTQQSTGEINEMIAQLQSGSKSSVDAMNKSREQAGFAVSKAEAAGKSLNTIAKTVTQISDLSTQIATAAEEQTAVSEEINRNIIHINDASILTANGTNKTVDAISNLARTIAELQNLVRQFKIPSNTTPYEKSRAEEKPSLEFWN